MRTNPRLMIAASALAALLCCQLPGGARALWGDSGFQPTIDPDGGTHTQQLNLDEPQGSDTFLSVTYSASNGESVTGPATVTVPEGYTSTLFDVDYGAANTATSYIEFTVSDGTDSDTTRLYYEE